MKGEKTTSVHNEKCETILVPGPISLPWPAPGSYHSEFIGGGIVLKQDVDYMCMSLLSCLMQWRIPILWKEGGRNDSFPQTPSMISVDTKEKGVYLCFGINFCRMLEQEINDLDVSIVATHVEWGVSHL